jgi:hypothetical protein
MFLRQKDVLLDTMYHLSPQPDANAVERHWTRV